ncbi:copper homeostasis membrane protein CopD [Mesorhizobium sp. BR1-1-16]|uniref:copper homeostasis membrane protein CopD n=1 Tax=Mesorhizobium sp. BR1-1-16 TaxID=2876653 RepID=UPI001CCD74E7|nr:copper homeostasis membrane protein CopD [Mesorhizobium sp. BR1-1-16]MBZ9937212.1 copper homeostasis membrane protein CopD [Mesorhizobium sp. BR1-1-16]
MTPELALSACRFLHDAAAMLLWGAFGYLVLLVPCRLADDIAGRLSGLRTAAILVAAATVFAALPIQTALIGDGWADAFDGAMLRDVVTGTSVGTAWLWQAIPSAALLLTLGPRCRFHSGATALLAGMAVVALAAGGHARMNEGWQAVIHPANDALHGLAAGAWLGALVPLLPILARLSTAGWRADAALALKRFSTGGHIAVALVVVTGIFNSFMIVGWPLGLSPPYRALLTAKLAVVATMTAIALLNRYGFVPRIGADKDRAVRAIAIGTIVEIGLGLAAILLVAIFGMMDPGG